MVRSAPVSGGLNRFTEWLIIWLLKRVRQPWSRQFMEAMASLMAVFAVEAVILRRSAEGIIEVLLQERPGDDIHWIGTLCVPGTVIRAIDQPISDQPLFQGILDRLALGELHARFTTSRFVGIHHYGAGGRANTIQVVFLCTLRDTTQYNGWYPVDDLPARFLQGQQPIIDMAVAHFAA